MAGSTTYLDSVISDSAGDPSVISTGGLVLQKDDRLVVIYEVAFLSIELDNLDQVVTLGAANITSSLAEYAVFQNVGGGAGRGYKAAYVYVYDVPADITAILSVDSNPSGLGTIPDCRILAAYVVRGASVLQAHANNGTDIAQVTSESFTHSDPPTYWVSILSRQGTHGDTSGNWSNATRVHKVEAQTLVADVAADNYPSSYSASISGFPLSWATGVMLGFNQGIQQASVLTVYDAGMMPGEGMNLEVVAPKLTAEQMQKIERGDRRFYPEV